MGCLSTTGDYPDCITKAQQFTKNSVPGSYFDCCGDGVTGWPTSCGCPAETAFGVQQRPALMCKGQTFDWTTLKWVCPTGKTFDSTLQICN